MGWWPPCPLQAPLCVWQWLRTTSPWEQKTTSVSCFHLPTIKPKGKYQLGWSIFLNKNAAWNISLWLKVEKNIGRQKNASTGKVSRSSINSSKNETRCLYKYMQPSIQYWTDHTQPNRTQTPNQPPSLISVTAQGRLQVCYGGPRDKDPGWPLSRPRVDIKSRPISEADPKITFQCLSKIVYLDYTRGGLTGGKKKDDSASHFNGWADHKSWPRSAYRVCFDVRLCLVGTVFIICGFFHIW